MTRYFLFSFYSALLLLCVSCVTIPKGHFSDVHLPAPDYALPKNWSALPDRLDSADLIAIPEWKDMQATAAADVFFLHPTSYTGQRGQTNWNADINDAKVNEDVDAAPIRYQATIFNGAGKVYAPRYRQAHLKSFFTKKNADAKLALDLAYADVRDAFKYYLDHYNQGRPF